MTLEEMMTLAPVVPVLTIEDADHAVPLGRALVKGGLRMLEVTLRTPAATEAIRRMAREVEGAVVGAGTALNAQDVRRAIDAGARFIVSPGLMDDARREYGAVPLLPGVATATELMRGLNMGFSFFKFFPAVQAGGVGMLKAFAPVFPQARFCPTGGITLKNASDFLGLPNVLCVGGSWVAPGDVLRNGEWDSIAELARGAAELRRP